VTRTTVPGRSVAPKWSILELLGKTRPTSSGWLARCPAHDDGNPSLTVGYGRDGRVLAHCWAGCAFEDIEGPSGSGVGAAGVGFYGDPARKVTAGLVCCVY
jgi:hypothetical protein